MADPLYRFSPLVANFASATLTDESFVPNSVVASGGVAASNDFPLFGNTTARFPDGGTGKIQFTGSALPLNGTMRVNELWAYLTSVNPNNTALIDTRDDAGLNGIYVAVLASDSRIEVGGHSPTVFSSPAGAFTLNAWHHVAHVLSYTGAPGSLTTTHRLYLNGALVGTMNGGTGAAPTRSSNRLIVGAAFNAGFNASGAFGPIRVTNVARYFNGDPFVPPADIFPTTYAAPATPISGPMYRAATTGLPTDVVHRLERNVLNLRDREFGGRGTVYGTVQVQGTPNFPKFARVRLVDEQSGITIRETWSNATTGFYTFDNIDPTRKYTVLAYDPAKNLRAVVADNLTPEPM